MAFQPSSLPTLNPSDTTDVLHRGFRGPDPFAPRERPGANFVNAILATALFRCWHLLLFFGAWSTLVTVLNHQGHNVHFSNTLLTVVGTVLGFVISYRTTSSFERYNEGRRLWSSIVYASRTFSRTVWFHVLDPVPPDDSLAEETAACSLIEKKSVLNLLEAFAASVKHYLRGEDGIYYQDLYYLVKFLPAYALPAGIPHPQDPTQAARPANASSTAIADEKIQVTSAAPVTSVADTTPSPTEPSPTYSTISHRTANSSSGFSTYTYETHSTKVGSEDSQYDDEIILPHPVTSPVSKIAKKKKARFLDSNNRTTSRQTHNKKAPGRPLQRGPSLREKVLLPKHDEKYLMPARMPPKLRSLNCFPFSTLIEWLSDRVKLLKSKKAARLRARMKNSTISHNLPLEITLYLSSYIAAVQERKQADVPTTNLLLGSLNQLVDALTSLERILTTPIPFSYSFHLWTVTLIYCFFLPCQIWPTFGWLTIPGSVIVCFMFLGFLAAGEEIENPFGYDRNDLNLDHFTQNIIPNELRALTSAPPPHPSAWAFSPQNDLLFVSDTDALVEDPNAHERVTPREWLSRGKDAMIDAMSHNA